MAKEAKNKEKKMQDNNNKKNSKKEKKHFFKDVKAELKKVIWPTPKQLLTNTVAVIVYALIVGVIVFVLDICFEKINTFGVEKLKTIVKSSEENNEISNKEEIENPIDSNNEVDSSTEDSKDNNTDDAK